MARLVRATYALTVPRQVVRKSRAMTEVEWQYGNGKSNRNNGSDIK